MGAVLVVLLVVMVLLLMLVLMLVLMLFVTGTLGTVATAGPDDADAIIGGVSGAGADASHRSGPLICIPSTRFPLEWHVQKGVYSRILFFGNLECLVGPDLFSIGLEMNFRNFRKFQILTKNVQHLRK